MCYPDIFSITTVVLWTQGGPTISYVLWGADGQVSPPALTHSANVHTPQQP